MSKTILKMEGITKRFSGITALNNVGFECTAGEIHALVGENGAGKSTLMKIISGAYTQDSGNMYFKEELVDVSTPRARLDMGIGIIMQEFNLLPYLTVEQNIFLGREQTGKFRLIDQNYITEKSREVLALLNVDIDPKAMVNSLTVAQRQFVEIAKSLSLGAELLIMDEPSATLTGHELVHLFDVIRNLKEKGTAIIYISHRLVEIFEIADRVTVLKDGQVMGTKDVTEVTQDQLVEMMVGRQIAETFPKRSGKRGEQLLTVENVTTKKLPNPVSLQLNRGEVVGLAGLVGSGRTELARAIFGSDRLMSGRIVVEDKEVKLRLPYDAVRHGIALIPEDRKLEGLIVINSLQHNIGLPNLKFFSKLGFVNRRKEAKVVKEKIQQLSIRCSGARQKAEDLSGGNQQKVVIAKWLVELPKVIIMDEPTRGIDVGSKAEIYQIIHDLAEQGLAVLMISSELPEILGLADRILVMHEKRLVAELDGGTATEEMIMRAATGNENVIMGEG